MKTQIVRGLLSLALVAVLAAACSSSESSEPASTTSESAQSESDDSGEQSSESVDEESTDDDSRDDDSSEDSETAPSATPEPSLDDQDLASVQDLQSGEQVEDAQGNLIAIYGIAIWPEPFSNLSDSTQAEFPFFGDIEMVADPSSQLVVLDVGMCAAGVDARGFGTAEFFVHESSTEVLSTDPLVGRGVLARHPIARPGFGFPSPAECERGFLPVLWSSDRTPEIARYVLATRASAGADVEQHVYQWELDVVAIGADDVDADDADTDQGDTGRGDTDQGDTGRGDIDEPQFAVGQTVTFNQGVLLDTTVMIDGWAELIGTESPIEGTRLVAVSLDYCPSSARLPEFGIGVDNWNIVAPLSDAGLEVRQGQDPATTCFEGWLEFAIPFGSVPTAFFASDGVNSTVGYAEWSLFNAALPAPQS